VELEKDSKVNLVFCVVSECRFLLGDDDDDVRIACIPSSTLFLLLVGWHSFHGTFFLGFCQRNGERERELSRQRG
jgi:hypothetical protein